MSVCSRTPSAAAYFSGTMLLGHIDELLTGVNIQFLVDPSHMGAYRPH